MSIYSARETKRSANDINANNNHKIKIKLDEAEKKKQKIVTRVIGAFLARESKVDLGLIGGTSDVTGTLIVIGSMPSDNESVVPFFSSFASCFGIVVFSPAVGDLLLD